MKTTDATQELCLAIIDSITAGYFNDRIVGIELNKPIRHYSLDGLPFVTQSECIEIVIVLKDDLSNVRPLIQEKLTPIHECINLTAKYKFEKNWGTLGECMSVRLRNCFKSYELLFQKRPIYYETATFNELYRSIRNFGKKSWDEFEELRKTIEIKY